jgi:hypothetical protein
MDEDLTETMPDSHLAFQPANHVGSHDLGLTSSSDEKHKDLVSGMAVKSVAIQLAHVVHQLRVVVEDVAHESINARSRVLHPLHKGDDLRISKHEYIPAPCLPQHSKARIQRRPSKEATAQQCISNRDCQLRKTNALTALS